EDDGASEVVGSNGRVAARAVERETEREAGLLDERRPLDVGGEVPASNPVSPRFDVTPNPVAPFWNRFDWKVALSLAWLAGLFAVMARLTVGTTRVWLLTRRAHRVTESSWIILARTLATRLRLRRRGRVFKTERISMPMTWGLIGSGVLLPKGGE